MAPFFRLWTKERPSDNQCLAKAITNVLPSRCFATQIPSITLGESIWAYPDSKWISVRNVASAAHGHKPTPCLRTATRECRFRWLTGVARTILTFAMLVAHASMLRRCSEDELSSLTQLARNPASLALITGSSSSRADRVSFPELLAFPSEEEFHSKRATAASS